MDKIVVIKIIITYFGEFRRTSTTDRNTLRTCDFRDERTEFLHSIQSPDTPKQEPKNHSSLPIIVWFHEGLFQRGASTFTKAKYLMDRDAILVTLNYRVGLFGFMSTEDYVVSGNMGLKDQNVAIQWVVDNIRFFGGDPKKISLFSDSAGGSSVHYHYLSKSSAGLFRNGVSFSGTALSHWAYDPKPLETARKLAKAVGCSTKSSTEMVDCLKCLSAHNLLVGVKEMLKEITNLYYAYPLFMPVAEKNVTDYFIDRSPEEILRSGDVYDVPWTSGDVSQEGTILESSVVFNETKLSYIDKNSEKLTPYTLMYDETVPMHMHAEVARAARQHYLKTHRLLFTILEKSTRLHAKASKSPVYTYYYSYRAAMSMANYLSGTDFNFGTCHLDDIFLVLENQYIDPTTTKSDRDVLENMLDFWLSLATGKPSLRDKELTRIYQKNRQFKFMNIPGPSNYTLQSTDNFGNKKFWNSLGFDLES